MCGPLVTIVEGYTLGYIARQVRLRGSTQKKYFAVGKGVLLFCSFFVARERLFQRQHLSPELKTRNRTCLAAIRAHVFRLSSLVGHIFTHRQ